MREICKGVSLILLALCAATGARADVVVLVPPHVEQGVLSEQTEQALETLSRALKVDGFDLIRPGQSGPAAEEAQTRDLFPKDHNPLNCVTPDCAVSFARLFDAAFAVQISLFRQPGRGISVTVVIVESTTAYFSGSSQVEGGDLSGAVRDAYQGARTKQAEGVGPWLSVTGKPEGATVYVDGSEYGRVPILRRRIEAGVHRLVLQADGYTTFDDSVDIPTRIDHEETRHVELELLNRQSPAVAHAERHWLDYTVGGLAIAAGAAFVTFGVRDYVSDGECAKRVDGECRETYVSDSLSVVNVAAGAAGVALGIATIWAGPFGLWLHADTQRAALHVRTSF
jgi:hypothetical protein